MGRNIIIEGFDLLLILIIYDHVEKLAKLLMKDRETLMMIYFLFISFSSYFRYQ